jgi:hypothetical protein
MINLLQHLIHKSVSLPLGVNLSCFENFHRVPNDDKDQNEIDTLF